MINYLKKNIASFVIGCILGIPIALCAVSQRGPATIPVCYSSEVFEQFSEQHVETDIRSYEMTDEELAEEAYYDSLELLACCVEAEAGNQGLIGKKYVVDVILNRVDDEAFPDSITDVIFHKNAFSVVLNNKINEVSPTEETFQAVREELENRTNSDVLYFTSEGYSKYGTPWKKIGDHYFSTK